MRWAASDVSPSSHLAFHILNTCRFFVLCCVLGVWGFVALSCFWFLFCKCFRIPNSPRSLDLDDRQGLIASSAMQQKKKNLPLRLHGIPCHHIPNRPLLSLTLQVSRSLLRILPPPLPPTLSPLHSPPSLILRSPSLTPPLAVAPLVGTQIPFSQHSYQIVIPLGSNDQGLPR